MRSSASGATGPRQLVAPLLMPPTLEEEAASLGIAYVQPRDPTPQELGAEMRAIVRQYRFLREPDRLPKRALLLVSDYLQRATQALERLRVGPSPYDPEPNDLMRTFFQALEVTICGQKHSLFHADAPMAPRTGPQAERRANLEAVAAAILESALEKMESSQSSMSKVIAKALAEAGYRGVRNGCLGAYSAAAVIKWRDSCQRETHPAHALYYEQLRALRQSRRPTAFWVRYHLSGPF